MSVAPWNDPVTLVLGTGILLIIAVILARRPRPRRRRAWSKRNPHHL